MAPLVSKADSNKLRHILRLWFMPSQIWRRSDQYFYSYRQ